MLTWGRRHGRGGDRIRHWVIALRKWRGSTLLEGLGRDVGHAGSWRHVLAVRGWRMRDGVAMMLWNGRREMR